MESATKRPSVVEGILSARNREVIEAEPRDAVTGTRAAVPTPMLDVVLRDGKIQSFSYAYLWRVIFTPGDRLELHFGEAVVVIEGRNLRADRDRVRHHKADAICEGTEAESDLKAEDAPHITDIQIDSAKHHTKEKAHETGRAKSIER